MRNGLRVWTGLVCMAGLMLLEVGCGGGSGGGGTTNPTPTPTVTLSASPTTITSGDSTKLTWSSTNAASCTASGGWSGTEPTSGSQSESPTQTSTYTLDCTGAGGSAKASAKVTVNPALAVSVTAASTVDTGATDKLSATVTGGSGSATVAWTANPNVGSFSSASGTSTTWTAPAIAPSPNTVTITATATDGSGDTATGSATLTLVQQFAVVVSPATTTASAGSTVALSASVVGAPSGCSTISYLWNTQGVGSLPKVNVASVTYSTPTMLQTNPETVPVIVTATAVVNSTTTTATAKAEITVGTSTTRYISSVGLPEVDTDTPAIVSLIVYGGGFTVGDEVTVSPTLDSFQASYISANSFQITFTVGTDSGWNPGAETITDCASDGTKCSPPGYFSLGREAGNLGGATATEEFRLNPGTYQILRNLLSTGASETPVTDSQNPFTMWGASFGIDSTGNYAIYNNLNAVAAVNLTNNFTVEISTSTAALVAGRNGIVSWSDPTNQEVVFWNPKATSSPASITDTNAGTARAISMTAGCGGTDAFFFDEQGLQLIRDSASLPSQLGAPTFKRVGSVDLSSGFSAASQINYPMFRRDVLTTDKSCVVGVLAPVVTGTNPDKTTSFKYALALVNGQNMTPITFQDASGTSLGQFLTSPYLMSNVKLAVMAPAGNAIYVETQNMTDGSSGLVKIASTPVSGSYSVSVTVTPMGTVSPTNGFFGTSMVMDANGKFIDLGMRTGSLIRVPLN